MLRWLGWGFKGASMIKLSKRNFPGGRKVTVSIRLNEELKKILERVAKTRGHEFSDFVREGLDQWAYAHLADKK